MKAIETDVKMVPLTVHAGLKTDTGTSNGMEKGKEMTKNFADVALRVHVLPAQGG